MQNNETPTEERINSLDRLGVDTSALMVEHFTEGMYQEFLAGATEKYEKLLKREAEADKYMSGLNEEVVIRDLSYTKEEIDGGNTVEDHFSALKKAKNGHFSSGVVYQEVKRQVGSYKEAVSEIKDQRLLKELRKELLAINIPECKSARSRKFSGNMSKMKWKMIAYFDKHINSINT